MQPRKLRYMANLIIDIGNTRTKIVVFEQEDIKAHTTTDHLLTGLKAFVSRHSIQHIIISATAQLTSEALDCIDSLPCPVLKMTGQTPAPVNVCYKSPQTLGTDRLAAVVEAHEQLPGQNILVIDAGTCITYDFIDSKKNYWGGNISPGLNMRLQAMHNQTARLPLIDTLGEIPEIGYNTETALRSGAILGVQLEIKGYIRHFQEKYDNLSVFLTGGDAKKLGISKESCIFADDFIVPRGLNRILEYNL